jgi:hypothetical protein
VGGPAQLQDAGNRQANYDESADEHTEFGIALDMSFGSLKPSARIFWRR